jgi:hypothetical protein
MLTKFVLSTALILGFASSALGQSDPEVNLIHTKPWLFKPSVQRQVPATATSAFAAVQQPVKPSKRAKRHLRLY